MSVWTVAGGILIAVVVIFIGIPFLIEAGSEVGSEIDALCQVVHDDLVWIGKLLRLRKR